MDSMHDCVGISFTFEIDENTIIFVIHYCIYVHMMQGLGEGIQLSGLRYPESEQLSSSYAIHNYELPMNLRENVSEKNYS